MFHIENQWLQFAVCVAYLAIATGVAAFYYYVSDEVFDDGLIIILIFGGFFFPITLLPVLAFLLIRKVFKRKDEDEYYDPL